jgi:hypothetical protein
MRPFRLYGMSAHLLARTAVTLPNNPLHHEDAKVRKLEIQQEFLQYSWLSRRNPVGAADHGLKSYLK